MMALDNYFLSQPSMDWDLRTFGGADQHMPSSSSVMASPMSSSSEASTGYLQDAVSEWNDRCKRRRAAARPYDPPPAEEFEDFLRMQVFWDSNCYEDPLANLNAINITDNNTTPASDGPLNSSIGEVAAPKQHEFLCSSDNSHKLVREERESSVVERNKKKKKAAGVVYPFTVVKPGGVYGDMTLADINERLLMRPTRPVRHPVGEFACVPCVSGKGPGLSGKAVVGFTRIQTRGRGTITIIRTRG